MIGWDDIGSAAGYAANPVNWVKGPVGVYSAVQKSNQANGNVNTTGPQPDYLPYNSGYDPKTMGLQQGLDQRLSGISMDPRGLQAFRQEALRQGPSAWASLAHRDQALQTSNARERGANEVNAQTAQAQDRLAAQGGLSSGARERSAEGGMKNYVAMSQDAARQERGNNLQIGMNDEQNRITQLGQLPGMEVQALQPDLQKAGMWEQARQTDVQQQVDENARKNAFNQNLHNQKMQAWGASKQADATSNAGKKGLFG